MSKANLKYQYWNEKIRQSKDRRLRANSKSGSEETPKDQTDHLRAEILQVKESKKDGDLNVKDHISWSGAKGKSVKSPIKLSGDCDLLSLTLRRTD
jgi:hypothetical protein